MANKKQDKKKGLTEEEILAEIKRLSDRAQETANQQLDLFNHSDLGDEDIDSAFDARILNDTADPDKSHKLYYGMKGLMVGLLPKGKDKESKEMRKIIYDEKSLFLNRGKTKDASGRKHSDERMSYIPGHLETAFATVVQWVQEHGSPFDLYMAFWKLNEERGYHSPEETPSFDKQLKGILNVPPPPKGDK